MSGQNPPLPELLAAVDLGSNSFHLMVVRYVDGELQQVDRVRERVRLAAGLDANGRLTKEAQAAKTNLRYYKSYESSIDVATGGDGDTQLVCFMNATPVSDVVAVCDSGEVMPQKSTFFFPKIPNGLVFYDLASEA